LFGEPVFEQVIEDGTLFIAEVSTVSFHFCLQSQLSFISHNPVRDGLRHYAGGDIESPYNRADMRVLVDPVSLSATPRQAIDRVSCYKIRS
jgi:hypothetical protein